MNPAVLYVNYFHLYAIALCSTLCKYSMWQGRKHKWRDNIWTCLIIELIRTSTRLLQFLFCPMDFKQNVWPESCKTLDQFLYEQRQPEPMSMCYLVLLDDLS